MTTTQTPASQDRAALDATARHALFATPQTVYHFTDEPVDAAQLRRAYEDARWAPTAFNAQPLRLLSVSTPEARERLHPHMAPGNADRTTAAPAVLITAFDPRWHEHLPHLAGERGAGLRDSFEDKEAMRRSTGRDSALLQVGYLILALRANGLQVGPMTGFDAEGVRAEFLAELGWDPLVVLAIGHEAHPEREGAVRPRGGRFEFDDVTRVV